MTLVRIKDMHLSFGERGLFEQLSLEINKAGKIGLVGPNGCGKTTLLKTILGSLEPDIGQVNKKKNLRIGYLPQEAVFDDDKSVIEQLHAGAREILELQRKLQVAAQNLSGFSGGELKAAMREYDRLGSEFELAGGFAYETRTGFGPAVLRP
jgi:ATPase subunit of ABC transporter with duplicated ATPase domains